MSDKPRVGDLVWVEGQSEIDGEIISYRYATDYEEVLGSEFDHLVLPTEVVQIKRLMDDMQEAVACLSEDDAGECIGYIAEMMQEALDEIKADGRVTIEREGKG